LDRDRLGCRRLQRGRGVALPEAGRCHGVRDRADRRPSQPRDLVAGGAWRARPARLPLAVRWPRDDAKLDRVRAAMEEAGLDALVVRAPDNVLYLTNFWAMKGYDAAVFPREGEPTLICLEASADDAARNAWTNDVRLFAGYAPDDPRPPIARTLDLTRMAAREHERVGLELSMGTQASDRMVG